MNAKKRLQSFLPKLVDKLGTALETPETACVVQDSMPNDEQTVMFFINKGTCKVNVTDQQGKEPVEICELEEGDHFGEIHLLWNCARTATVVSNNYNTHARLKRANFEELVA
jgi:CRP-like cAMP-binding protein